jgi:hypothetical protein
MTRYGEKKIRSIKELKELIEILEPDEGIRVISSSNDEEGFIFVTRSPGRYCVNLCEKVFDESLGAMVPGGKEAWHYVTTADEVWKFIEAQTTRPLEAWLY